VTTRQGTIDARASHFSRPGVACRLRPVGTSLLVLALGACGAPDAARVLRGESGPVAWEVSDITQTSEEQGLRLRWDYMLTLQNAGPTGLNITKAITGIITPGESWGGQGEEPFTRRLDAGAELRMLGTYSHWCRDCNPAYAETVFRQGVTRVLIYEGVDDQQRPVKVTVRIPLHRGVGTSASERRPGSGFVGRYHGMLNYYPARSARQYTTENIRVRMEAAGSRLSGEIATPQQRGTIQATFEGEELSGDFRLGDVTCTMTGKILGDGATVTGTFECGTGEAGSLVLNRL
jgi:hypothetical protein